MSHSRFLLVAVLLSTLGSCASDDGGEGEPLGDEARISKENDKEVRERRQKRHALERDLAIAREKLQKAKLDLGHQEEQGAAAVAKAEEEAKLAAEKLRHFGEWETPQRVEKARLELQQARDFYEDSKEELEQLELMYEGDDLADKTKEIVLRRGRRRLELSARRLELRTRELENLEVQVLPQEQARIQLEVTEAGMALQKARQSRVSAAIERKIAVLVAEAEIARLEEELQLAEQTGQE